jgi:hypothetical protein
MYVRKRWVGFRVQRVDGGIDEYELDDRGRLKEPPPRQARRRRPFTDAPDLEEAPRLRTARLVNAPAVPCCEHAADAWVISEPSDRDCFCPVEEAYPGPYAGSADESLFNDGFSFGFMEDDVLFDDCYGFSLSN